ncbi:hypothetical protein RHSIM_Rhsim10G0148500 [Rhododendron simsii]|uniref:Uncharacterized protein n=1 Tax=Rhododendron simsii TaxID=118357 RepID=A0A834LAF2_RHOSS|nr:hypothetical protein RHSIM_Rhsim10G0148500 [Rhododendron simsii]
MSSFSRADLFSESQRIQYTIQTRAQDIPDARTYLLTLKEIRIRRGLTDEFGVEAMMMEALEKVEKELKKPLMRNDKKGMALLMSELIRSIRTQLEVLKKDAIEAMETQKKRPEFKDEEIVDVRSLDIRNSL